jgi:hypothetical protein
MQLILSFFLEGSPPQKKQSIKLDPEARTGAIKSLVRIIAQAADVTEQRQTTDE